VRPGDRGSYGGANSSHVEAGGEEQFDLVDEIKREASGKMRLVAGMRPDAIA